MGGVDGLAVHKTISSFIDKSFTMPPRYRDLFTRSLSCPSLSPAQLFHLDTK